MKLSRVFNLEQHTTMVQKYRVSANTLEEAISKLQSGSEGVGIESESHSFSKLYIPAESLPDWMNSVEATLPCAG